MIPFFFLLLLGGLGLGEGFLQLQTAHFFQDTNSTTEIYIEFEGILDTSDLEKLTTTFRCTEQIGFFSEGSSLLDNAETTSCLFCPEEQLSVSSSTTQGILVVPLIESATVSDSLQRSISEGDLIFTLNFTGQAPVIIEVMEPPQLERIEQINSFTTLFTFDNDFSVIRGEIFNAIENSEITARCDDLTNLFQYPESDANAECDFSFASDGLGLFVTVSDNTFDVDNIAGVPGIINDTFFSFEEKYGIEPTDATSLELTLGPRLMNSSLLIETIDGTNSAVIELNFDSNTAEVEAFNFNCNELFLITFRPEELEGTIDIVNSDSELLCNLQWNRPSSAHVWFSDTLPIITEGDAFISIVQPDFDHNNGFQPITKPDGSAFAFGSNIQPRLLSLLEYQELFSFSVVAPAQLTACDESFTVEVVQLSGPAVETSVEFDIPEVNNCSSVGSVNTCSLDEQGGDLNFTVTVSSAGFDLEQVLFDTEVSIPVDQSLSKLPASVAGVIAGSTVTITRGVAKTFTGVVGSVSSCNFPLSSTSLNFLWKVEQDASEQLTASTKAFTIGALDLKAGIYSVQFDVSTEEEGFENSSVAFSLVVEAAEIIVASANGINLSVPVNQNFTLDATKSCDPNELDANCDEGLGFIGELSDPYDLAELGFSDDTIFDWGCSNCGEDIDLLNAKLRLAFPPNSLTGDTVELSLSIENVIKVFTLNLIPAIDECVAPIVSISPVASRLNVDQIITLFGAVSITEGVDLEWTVSTTGSTPDLFIGEDEDNQRNRVNLVLAANTLEEGVTYDFTLTAIDSECDEDQASFGFSTVSFTTNRNPLGGSLQVIDEDGSTFTLITSDWRDPEGDLPLTYAFEVAYIASDEFDSLTEIPSTLTTTLRGFSAASTFTVALPVTEEDVKMVLIGLAKDSRGGISKRLISTTNSNTIVANPFEQVSDASVVINVLLDSLTNNGDSDQIPNQCNAITTALDALESIGDEEEVQNLKRICLNATLETLNSETTDPAFVDAVANSILTNTANTEQIVEENLQQAAEGIEEVIDRMLTVVTELVKGDTDSAASGLIPDSFVGNVAQGVSNFLKGANSRLDEESSNSSRKLTLTFPERKSNRNVAEVRKNGRKRRQLEGEVDSDDIFTFAQDNIRDLLNTQNTFQTSGTRFEATADDIALSTTTESVDDLGSLTKTLTLPEGNDNSVTLPDTLGNDTVTENRQATGQQISIQFVKWTTNILNRQSAVIPTLECLDLYNYKGPQNGLEGNILSLDFFAFDDSIETFSAEDLKLTDLENPIEILLDDPSIYSGNEIEGFVTCEAQIQERTDQSVDYNYFINETYAPQCGFFDESTGDFTTEFCTAEVELTGLIKCSCNHATDYAAWNAFRYDVKGTLKSKVVITEEVQRIFFTIIPLLVLAAVLLVIWARKEDEKDSIKIMQGALARVKLMKMIANKQKRHFFEGFEQAKLEKAMGIEFQDPTRLSTYFDANRVEEPESKQHLIWWKQFYLAIKYEHSVFGIIRFDPNFSRVQRAAIFICVIVANFGAAGLIFELRNNLYGVSILFTLAVSLFAAFLVSIPIKLLARLLFKTTENSAASMPDMVSNIYKILTRVEKVDGTLSDNDNKLLEAIHEFYLARRTLDRIALRAESVQPEKDGRDIHSSTPEESNPATEANMAVGVVVGGNNGDNVEEVAEIVDESQVSGSLEAARAVFIQAKKKVFAETTTCRDSWRKERSLSKVKFSQTFYSSFEKIRLVKKQQSSFLKFAALASDQPSPAAHPRQTWFREQMVYIDWLILLSVTGFYGFYIIKFVGTRAEASINPNNEAFDIGEEPLTETEYFNEWVVGALGGIIVSYFIAEPLIGLFRYVIFPALVQRYGRPLESMDEADVEINQFTEEKAANNIREGYAHMGFDLMADLVENAF